MNTSRTVGWRDWHRKSLEIRQAKARARGEEVLLLIQAWRQDGRSWQNFWTPPVSGRRVAAVGIPTGFAGCGQDGCVGSCACCCRVSRGIFVAEVPRLTCSPCQAPLFHQAGARDDLGAQRRRS
jgi:hypothetical protein